MGWDWGPSPDLSQRERDFYGVNGRNGPDGLDGRNGDSNLLLGEGFAFLGDATL